MSAQRSIFSFSKKHPVTDDYEFCEKLGSGAFSTVFRAEHKVNGDEVAIKSMKRKAITIKELRREVYIMREVCGHENIISLIDIYEEEAQIHLVLELVTGGELFEKIVEMEYYSESDAAKLIHQLIKIVKFLHSKNIVHRDLKPENLLFADPSAEKMKLCDFGLADYMGKNVGLTGVVGSRTYMAPEVLKMKSYGKPVDMYSIGVIMYILLCGYPPFDQEQGIVELEFPSPDWDKVSDTAKKLIANLLAKDPAKRLTAEQAAAHRWILGETASSKPLTNSVRTLQKFNTSRRSGTTMERPKQTKTSVFSVFEQLEEEATSPTERQDSKTDVLAKSKEPTKKVRRSNIETESAPSVGSSHHTSTDSPTNLPPNLADRTKERSQRDPRRNSVVLNQSSQSSTSSGGEDKVTKIERESRHQKAQIEVLKRDLEVVKKLLQETEDYNAENRRKIKEELWKIQKDNQDERRKRTKLTRSIAHLEDRLDEVYTKLGIKIEPREHPTNDPIPPN